MFMSMNISKASVHDSHFLNNIKHSGIKNATLLGDKGYLSSQHQLDLFESCNIQLKTPMRSNQNEYKKYSFIFRKCKRELKHYSRNLVINLCSKEITCF